MNLKYYQIIVYKQVQLGLKCLLIVMQNTKQEYFERELVTFTCYGISQRKQYVDVALTYVCVYRHLDLPMSYILLNNKFVMNNLYQMFKLLGEDE